MSNINSTPYDYIIFFAFLKYKIPYLILRPVNITKKAHQKFDELNLKLLL